MERNALIEVRNLSSFYQDGGGLRKKTRQQVLRDVSFDLYEGEILGLVGESGGGKSTLAKILCGMVHSYTGSVTVRGGPPQMVFQDPYSSLNPAHTVGWILSEPLRIQGMKAPQRQQEVARMLHQVGLSEDFAQRRPQELSGGQRQRVCIAGAIIGGQRLLLADEPVSALDVTTQAQILQLFLQLRKEFGLSCLFITHDLNLVYQICDRAMVLQNGQIVEQNTVPELFAHPKHPYTLELLRASS